MIRKGIPKPTIGELAGDLRKALDAAELQARKRLCIHCGYGTFRWALRDITMKREMTYRLLNEERHHPDCYSELLKSPAPCDCGLDDRVRGYLELLAAIYQEEA